MPRFVTRTHTQDVDADHLSYAVRTEGSTEPLNEAVTIEVLGSEAVESPLITVNGRGNYRTTESMATEITHGCHTDEEKALAIFNWVRTHAHHQYSGDLRGLHPVVFFNVFAHGICAYFAATQTSLARAAGLQARVWEIKNHTVGEIFYAGAWHLLDPDCHIFYLHRDNRTIASIAQIEQDLEFLQRSRAYRRLFQDAHGRVRNQWQSQHLIERYDLAEPRYVQYDYDRYTYAPCTMDYTLRPGEQITRAWQGDGRHYDYRNQRRFEPLPQEPHKVFPPVCYGNGHVLYRPLLDAALDVSGDHAMNVVPTDTGLRVQHPQDSLEGSRSLFVYRRALPYLLVGGQLLGEGLKEGASAYDRLEIVGFKYEPKLERRVYHDQREPGRRRFEASLDDFLYPGADQCAWAHEVHVLMGSYAGNQPPTTTALTDLQVRTDFQVAPQSLPALKLGDNRVELLHRSPEGARPRLRVTHTWTERHGMRLSKPPRLLEPAAHALLGVRSGRPQEQDTRARTPQAPDQEDARAQARTACAEKPQAHAYPTAAEIDADASPTAAGTDGEARRVDAITFRWRGAEDDQSYHFQLSRHPRCAFPIAPNFDLDLDSAVGKTTVAHTWMAADETYYWRVRARNGHGLWGAWSAIRSFTYAGDGP